MRNHAWEAASDVYKAAGASTVYTRMPFLLHTNGNL